MNLNHQNIDFFLSLLRLGIGHEIGENLVLRDATPSDTDWDAVKELANRQGLVAVVMDGVEKLPESVRPPKALMLNWIGNVLQSYENRYEVYRKAIAEMAEFFRAHGIKMMVLKGVGVGLNWPVPAHRPCGDIDIWQFGDYKKADALLTSEKGIKVDNSHHHHTVFYWRGFMVENHYDFVNVHGYRSSAELEKIFKELGKDDSHFVEVEGERVYLPSANLHALFLLRHMSSHFAAVGINLRQLLDWAFFVEKHGAEIDWSWLIGILEKYHMMDFFDVINAICVEDLGFDVSLFPGYDNNESSSSSSFLDLKKRVLMDIIEPEYPTSEPSALIPRLLYKFRRWKGNGWKQKLCYNENRFVSFWRGLWAHFLKPCSF